MTYMHVMQIVTLQMNIWGAFRNIISTFVYNYVPFVAYKKQEN